MLIDCEITKFRFVERSKTIAEIGHLWRWEHVSRSCFLTNKIERPSARQASDLMRALIHRVVVAVVLTGRAIKIFSPTKKKTTLADF